MIIIKIIINLNLIIIFKMLIVYQNFFKYKKEINLKEIYLDTNLNPLQTIGKYPGYNNFLLNYENECSKYFKYEKNSKTDIVIFAYTFRPGKHFFQVFDNIMDTFKNSVPNAIIPSVIPHKEIFSEGANILKKHGIKLLPFKGYENYNIVTSRYFAIYDFLKNNSNKYKRVFLSDIDDVYMFRDIFSTFNEDEIIINKQCHQFESENCHKLFPIDAKWFNTCFIQNTNNSKF